MADWGTFEQRDQGLLQAVHVTPLFDPEHICTADCWCHPQIDEDDPMIIVHNVAH